MSCSRQLFICLVLMPVHAVFAGSASSRTELLAAVSESRAHIEDFEASFAVSRIAGSSSHVSGSSEYVAWADGMIRVEKEIPTPSGANAFIASTADGLSVWQYMGLTRVATRMAALNEHHEIDGMGVFEVMAFFPPVTGGTNRGLGRDLEYILQDTSTVVDGETDEVDGHPCHVVKALSGGEVVHRLWIDPERNYMPRKQQFYFADTGELAVDVHVVEFSEVNGYWIPTAAIRTTSSSVRYDEGEVPSMYSFEIQRDHLGFPVASVNSNLPDSHFDYSTDIPPGTLVADEVSGATWFASGLDFRAAAETALASLGPVVDKSIASMHGKASESVGAEPELWAQLGVPWAVMSGLCAFLAVAGLAPRRAGRPISSNDV